MYRAESNGCIREYELIGRGDGADRQAEASQAPLTMRRVLTGAVGTTVNQIACESFEGVGRVLLAACGGVNAGPGSLVVTYLDKIQAVVRGGEEPQPYSEHLTMPDSSWGISAHGATHMVAVSSNAARITLFRVPQSWPQFENSIPEVLTTPVHELSGHEGNIPCVTFSTEGTILVSCSIDLTVRLWDVREGVQILQVLATQRIGPGQSLQEYWVWSAQWVPAKSVKKEFLPQSFCSSAYRVEPPRSVHSHFHVLPQCDDAAYSDGSYHKYAECPCEFCRKFQSGGFMDDKMQESEAIYESLDEEVFEDENLQEKIDENLGLQPQRQFSQLPSYHNIIPREHLENTSEGSTADNMSSVHVDRERDMILVAYSKSLAILDASTGEELKELSFRNLPITGMYERISMMKYMPELSAAVACFQSSGNLMIIRIVQIVDSTRESDIHLHCETMAPFFDRAGETAATPNVAAPILGFCSTARNNAVHHPVPADYVFHVLRCHGLDRRELSPSPNLYQLPNTNP